MKKEFIILLFVFLCVHSLYSQDTIQRRQILSQLNKKVSFEPLTIEELRNETYVDVNYGMVHLKNGQFIINKKNNFIGDLRHVAWGDLDGDGNDDAVVVLFSYQGGNDPDETLCAVLNDHGKPKIIACKGFDGHVDSIKIVDGVIIIRKFIWAEDDAHCCPSKHAYLHFIFNDKEFKRLD
jgi:hypothetical protein